MKAWKFTYTEDKEATYQTTIAEAETYSKAYIKVRLKISKDGMITDGKEIKTKAEITEE